MVTDKLCEIPLQDVWAHEAQDFTPWLLNNLDELSSALPFELVQGDKEQSAGTSWVDIVASDSNGETIVIENQLKTSDHDHLGKVITYLSAYDARAAVWIVGDARPEHVKAVTWLNELGDTDFYLVKVAAVKIGDSPPAALFTVITGPSPTLKEAGKIKRKSAEKKKDAIAAAYFQNLEALEKPDLVELANWALDTAPTHGLQIDWGKLGPMLVYRSPSVGKCAFGRIRHDGRLGLGNASLFITCKRKGLPLEIARDYMDSVAALIPGARRVAEADAKWGEREKLIIGDGIGVPGLPPLEPLVSKKDDWFSIIETTVARIREASGQ